MRRYDALSHNSYLHAIAALGHAQNRAPYATGAIAGEDGVIRETQRCARCFCSGFGQFT